MPQLARYKVDGHTLRCQAIYESGQRVGEQCSYTATEPDYDFCNRHMKFKREVQTLRHDLRGLKLASDDESDTDSDDDESNYSSSEHSSDENSSEEDSDEESSEESDEDSSEGSDEESYRGTTARPAAPFNVVIVNNGVQPRSQATAAASRPAAAASRTAVSAAPSGTGDRWIGVFESKGNNTKQRVLTDLDRVGEHVRQLRDEGLYVVDVTCKQNRWALVAHAKSSTKYTAQTWIIDADPSAWIQERWQDGYQITAWAESDSGLSFVVMSKGTRFTQQCWKRTAKFPVDWRNEKLQQGYYVTAVAASSDRWTVVMSRNTGYVNQRIVYKFYSDFDAFTSNWNHGYSITACAGSAHHPAFVFTKLSTGKRGQSMENAKDHFPQNVRSEKWTEGKHLATFMYGSAK